MKKEFYANLDYNKSKRRSALLLSSLLMICILGTISIFVISKDYFFIIFFAIFLVIPFFAIPSTFKSYPIDGKPVVTITDKDITIGKETVKIKDIIRIKCIIELPHSKIDAENKMLLDQMKTAKPEDIYFGSFDITTRDNQGKIKIVYGHIDNLISAIETAYDTGVKHIILTYAIKKLTAESEYDFKGELAKVKEKEFQTASRKSKTKHLI
jgi:hypothetical protein